MSATACVKALNRCIGELQSLIERAGDYDFDEITVATLETSIRAIQRWIDAETGGAP